MSEKGGINYLLIVIIIIFTVGLATGSFYLMLTRLGGLGPTTGGEEEHTVGEQSRELGPITHLEEFTVNLGDRRFVRVQIALETDDSDVINEIQTRNPQIRDTIITIIRSKDYDDISAEEGITILRTEIMESINDRLREGRVTNVFFTEFMIQ